MESILCDPCSVRLSSLEIGSSPTSEKAKIYKILLKLKQRNLLRCIPRFKSDQVNPPKKINSKGKRFKKKIIFM